jgi:hypothetical protein
MLDSRVAFIQVSSQSGHDMQSVMDAQSDEMVKTINATTCIDLPCASAVIAHVNSGPWSASNKLKISTALSTAQAHTATSGLPGFGKSASRSLQHCDGLENYFVQEDWDFFNSKDYSITAKAERISRRMYIVGMTCPDVSLLKRAAAVVYMCIGEDLMPEKRRQLLHLIRTNIKQIDKVNKHPLAHRIRFPNAPADMDDDAKKFAYADTAGPVVSPLGHSISTKRSP